MDFMAVARRDDHHLAPPRDEAIGGSAEDACAMLRKTYLPEIERMKGQANAHVVCDDRSQGDAIAMAGQAKKLAIAIEKKRKEIIEKPGEFVKTVNAFVKSFRDNLDEIDRVLKSRIQTHMLKIKAEQVEAQERARVEAETLQAALDARAQKLQDETGENIPAVVVPAPVIPAQTISRSETGSAAYLRKSVEWEVVDIAIVPSGYLVIDKVAINHAIRAGIREIPGIRIYETETTVIRP